MERMVAELETVVGGKGFSKNSFTDDRNGGLDHRQSAEGSILSQQAMPG